MTNKPLQLELRLQLSSQSDADQRRLLLFPLAVKLSSCAVEKKTNSYTECSRVWLKAKVEQEERGGKQASSSSSDIKGEEEKKVEESEAPKADANGTAAVSPTTAPVRSAAFSHYERSARAGFKDRDIGIASIQLKQPPKTSRKSKSRGSGSGRGSSGLSIDAVAASLHVILRPVKRDGAAGLLTHVLTKGGATSMRPRQR